MYMCVTLSVCVCVCVCVCVSYDRDMVASVFTPEAVETLRPFIQHTVDQRVQVMRDSDTHTGDLIEMFALQVPTKVRSSSGACVTLTLAHSPPRSSHGPMGLVCS